MKPVLLIPGLGFNRRIFEALKFEEQAIPLTYAIWKEPLEGESLDEYALRIIPDGFETSGEFIVVGHSFGGIAAQHIAAQFPQARLILVSTIQSRAELPLHFRTLTPLGLHRIFSKGFVRRSLPFWAKQHGYVGDLRDLLLEMIEALSDDALQWQLKQLCNWKGTSDVSDRSWRIHGDADLTFPSYDKHKVDELISNGDHLLVYKQPDLLRLAIIRMQDR